MYVKFISDLFRKEKNNLIYNEPGGKFKILEVPSVSVFLSAYLRNVITMIMWTHKEDCKHIFTYRVVSVTKITGSSSDNWIY
jgi:hypothetical protein